MPFEKLLVALFILVRQAELAGHLWIAEKLLWYGSVELSFTLLNVLETLGSFYFHRQTFVSGQPLVMYYLLSLTKV